MRKVFLPGGTIESATVALLGNFDGVHKGHRFLAEKAVIYAKQNNLKSLVYTFERNIKNQGTLTENADKEKLFSELGIDIIAFQDINDEFFSLSPEVFVKDVIISTLKAKFVIVGENYTFGKNKSGKSADLKKLLEKYGVECEICNLLEVDNKVVSSTRIRELISLGEIKEANSLLSRRYAISGSVEHGNRIGRTMGFPTVNIRPFESCALPKFGVYAALVTMDGKKYKGVSNVGVKPTVGGKIPLVETYIFGAEGDLYGKEIEVEFEEFIRPEKKFSGIEELKEQIENDKKIAQNILNW